MKVDQRQSPAKSAGSKNPISKLLHAIKRSLMPDKPSKGPSISSAIKQSYSTEGKISQNRKGK